MGLYRSFIVWGAGVVLVLGTFLIFVAAGWPGQKNNCMNTKPNSCYCEAFNAHDAVTGAPGVRQPVNTWFNLYALFTSWAIAWQVYRDRKNGESGNPMRSGSWLADVYVFAAQFLGLGSMWFHASMKEWGGITDQMSMFIYAAFLIFYTVRRLWDLPWWAFSLFYLLTVVLNTIIGAFWTDKYSSLVLILIMVAAYMFFEGWMWKRSGKFAMGKLGAQVLWCVAVVAILAATVFWKLSDTGGPLCDPKSFFQPHGLLWHPLAGLMAILLYFYWRMDEDAA